MTAPLKAPRLLSAGALTLSAVLLLPIGAVAQDQPDNAPPAGAQAPGNQPQVEGETHPPAYIAAVDGIARLDREGQTETAERGVPLVPGDRLRTDGGRLELAFPNGSQVYVDRYTEVELQDPLSLRVARGRLYVRVASTIDAAERLIIDGPGALVEFQDDGEYRIAIGGTDAVEVELVVLRGQAALSSEGGNVLVPQGHRSVARDGAAPSTPEWSNAGQTTLEKWAADREALWQSGQYASRQYLPAELAGYASTFDRHGTWQNDETYGSVWYPATTTEDWRPYYDGRWDYTSNYGWTWIAAGDVWAYPTHHYGRWNLGSRGWYWIPSRRWGAAWVYWAVANDYVGWCPLGWNGRPVLNVFHYDRSYPARSRDPYRAWTVIPRTSFGRSQVARVFADRGRLDRDRPAFILQHRSPGVAPPRSPYPSRFNSRLANGRTTGSDRAPARGAASTRSPRSYGAYGSDTDSRGGSAVPRGTASEENETTAVSPYERARPYMPRPERAGSPTGDEGNTYRRAPADESPVRSPNGLWRDRRDRETDRDSDGRAGPGYAGPGYRVRDTPGMSGNPDRDRSPGMSDPNPGSRHPGSRRDNDNDNDGGRDRDRGNRGGSRDSSPPDRGASPRSGGDRDSGSSDRGSRGGDSGSSRSSGGGAVRRHP